MIDDDDDDVEDPFDDQLFRQRLESTLDMCHALGKSSLWIHVPMTRARMMEDMVALGLRFHHAERMTDVLNVWLKTDCQSKIPEYATHNIGVSAFSSVTHPNILTNTSVCPLVRPGSLLRLLTVCVANRVRTFVRALCHLVF